MKLSNINYRMMTAYHSQINALNEILNKNIVDMLSKYADINQKNWDRILEFATFIYNTVKQVKTGFPPFLLHGQVAETTLNMIFPFCPDNADDVYIAKTITIVEESRQNSHAQENDRQK